MSKNIATERLLALILREQGQASSTYLSSLASRTTVEDMKKKERNR
jgi:hypothetical protein